MALTFPLESLVKATLPAGMGFVGFIGIHPEERELHVWAPVPLEVAALISPAGPVPAEIFGGRPGWQYHFCPTYSPPPPAEPGPDPEAVRSARLARARATGRELAAWARGMGVWVQSF